MMLAAELALMTFDSQNAKTHEAFAHGRVPQRILLYYSCRPKAGAEFGIERKRRRVLGVGEQDLDQSCHGANSK